jgi:hypothetical protein
MSELKWYRVVLSTYIEGTDEEDAIREANSVYHDAIVESVTLVEEIAAPPTKSEALREIAEREGWPIVEVTVPDDANPTDAVGYLKR